MSRGFLGGGEGSKVPPHPSATDGGPILADGNASQSAIRSLSHQMAIRPLVNRCKQSFESGGADAMRYVTGRPSVRLCGWLCRFIDRPLNREMAGRWLFRTLQNAVLAPRTNTQRSSYNSLLHLKQAM